MTPYLTSPIKMGEELINIVSAIESRPTQILEFGFHLRDLIFHHGDDLA